MNALTEINALREAAYILSEKSECFDVGTPEYRAYATSFLRILSMVNEIENREAAELERAVAWYKSIVGQEA